MTTHDLARYLLDQPETTLATLEPDGTYVEVSEVFPVKLYKKTVGGEYSGELGIPARQSEREVAVEVVVVH